ncbi:hypothetical protein [Pseudaquabacterium terrae]|uniref:hypothetical protein n=1 Tax=Pseudaquabacterium terrae TaxID=2732868 RepID=UPI001FE5264F|nr:hypothetical protein [Aquabacterium terrae]
MRQLSGRAGDADLRQQGSAAEPVTVPAAEQPEADAARFGQNSGRRRGRSAIRAGVGSYQPVTSIVTSSLSARAVPPVEAQVEYLAAPQHRVVPIAPRQTRVDRRVDGDATVGRPHNEPHGIDVRNLRLDLTQLDLAYAAAERESVRRLSGGADLVRDRHPVVAPDLLAVVAGEDERARPPRLAGVQREHSAAVVAGRHRHAVDHHRDRLDDGADDERAVVGVVAFWLFLGPGRRAAQPRGRNREAVLATADDGLAGFVVLLLDSTNGSCAASSPGSAGGGSGPGFGTLKKKRRGTTIASPGLSTPPGSGSRSTRCRRSTPASRSAAGAASSAARKPAPTASA